MQKTKKASGRGYIIAILFLTTLAISSRVAMADPPADPKSPPMPVTMTTQEDHRQMMTQLGITRLRPGPSGNESAPNHANYDEALANPFPKLPELLVLCDGTPVNTADDWWRKRRPEIVDDFEREVYGRVPPNVPAVTWSVAETREIQVGDVAVIEKQLRGRVDNSRCPTIEVTISLTLGTPKEAAKPVPVLMMFGGFGFARPGFRPPGPSRTELLIRAGWGYAMISPQSIQADNGQGLTQGIIGLTNLGQPRKPDDWGSLRAWAWGASRGLDALETEPAVAKRVGIEGVSRYGKAALVAMAFEPRFAAVLVGSSDVYDAS